MSDAPSVDANREQPRENPVARAVRRIASWLYAGGARLHRSVSRRRAAARGRPSCAIVSVGGLTVGGAGKTPMAARIAWALAQRGHRVALASRGYKGKPRASVTVVSNGKYVLSNVESAGDEALVLAAHAPGVPVLVGRDRRLVGHHAIAEFGTQILVLDDGFQHHRLARDVDIVCIDAASGLGNGRVLPAGPLREPIDALARADWICVVDERAGDQAQEKVASWLAKPAARAGKALDAFGYLHARRRPVSLVSLDRSARRSLESLAGVRVGLLLGIARPGTVRRTVEGLGARVVTERCFPDHHAYRLSDVANLAPSAASDQGAEVWITTEKDALKILPAWVGAASVWVLRIEIEIDDETDFLERLEDRLRQVGRLSA